MPRAARGAAPGRAVARLAAALAPPRRPQRPSLTFAAALATPVATSLTPSCAAPPRAPHVSAAAPRTASPGAYSRSPRCSRTSTRTDDDMPLPVCPNWGEGWRAARAALRKAAAWMAQAL